MLRRVTSVIAAVVTVLLLNTGIPVLSHHGQTHTPVLTGTVNNGAITVAWQPVQGAVAYDVALWENPTDGWQWLTDGTHAETTLVYTDTVLGSHYWFAARAAFEDGSYGDWSDLLEIPVEGFLAPPALVAEPGDGVIRLSWQAVETAVRYEIWAWHGEWVELDSQVAGTEYVHKSPTIGTTYWYTIRSVNATGEFSTWQLDYPSAVVDSAPVKSTPAESPTTTGTPTETPTPTVTVYNPPSGGGGYTPPQSTSAPTPTLVALPTPIITTPLPTPTPTVIPFDSTGCTPSLSVKASDNISVALSWTTGEGCDDGGVFIRQREHKWNSATNQMGWGDWKEFYWSSIESGEYKTGSLTSGRGYQFQVVTVDRRGQGKSKDSFDSAWKHTSATKEIGAGTNPDHVIWFIDNTPNLNTAIGRFFMMVDSNQPSASATCTINGGSINCPPRTLVSLDITCGGTYNVIGRGTVSGSFSGTGETEVGTTESITVRVPALDCTPTPTP